MDKEIQFAKALQKIKELARLSGNTISKEEIADALKDLELNETQFQMIYEYLEKANIRIGDEWEMEPVLSGDDVDFIRLYEEELDMIGPCSEGEKEAVILSAMAGEETAKNRLIELKLREVIDIAKLYVGQGVLMEDLIGEGNTALSVGVSMLNCYENAKEAEDALAQIIMRGMEDAIRENEADAAFEENVLEIVNEIAEKAEELGKIFGRKVTVEELSEETGLSAEEIEKAVYFSGRQIEYLETGNINDAEDGI